VLKILNDQSHDSEAALIEANEAITNMKQRAKDTILRFKREHTACLTGFGSAARISHQLLSMLIPKQRWSHRARSRR